MKIHAPDITGSLNTLVGGNISGSITSTGSFGHIMKGGVNWDTAVSTSAATAGFTDSSPFTSAGISGSYEGGGSTKISGSSTSTGSFGTLKLINYNEGRGDSTNINIGQNAGSGSTTGDKHVNIGVNAGKVHTTTTGNVNIGYDNAITGDHNQANYNVAIGYEASRKVQAGDYDISIGYQAGYNGPNGKSVSIGYQAGKTNVHDSNVFIGRSAGTLSAGTSHNVAIGGNALAAMVGGNYNTAVGGNDAMSTLTEGDSNTAFGYNVARRILTGNQNTFIGKQAGPSVAAAPLTGDDNTVTGNKSGYLLQGTAKANTFVGSESGNNTTTGTGNIVLGFSGSLSSGSGDNQIVIGSGSVGLGDNQTVIGNSSQTHVVFGGDALISGSATSTGSFGKVVGDGSGLTKLQRPTTTHTTHFTASMTYAGHYNIVGGNLTCSILAEATASTAVGAEWEFFQTSSAGTMLFQSASLVNVYSKDGAMSITGQYSAASLKKVATNTWHLVGDLG